jgi:hypothetical protein
MDPNRDFDADRTTASKKDSVKVVRLGHLRKQLVSKEDAESYATTQRQRKDAILEYIRDVLSIKVKNECVLSVPDVTRMENAYRLKIHYTGSIGDSNFRGDLRKKFGKDLNFVSQNGVEILIIPDKKERKIFSWRKHDPIIFSLFITILMLMYLQMLNKPERWSQFARTFLPT